VLAIGLNRAVALLAEPKGAGRRGGGAPGKILGEHPADKQPVTLHAGRYGPYVKHGKLNATLPKTMTPETVTLDQAVSLLDERAAKGPAKRPARRKTGARPQAAAKASAPKAKAKPASKRKKAEA